MRIWMKWEHAISSDSLSSGETMNVSRAQGAKVIFFFHVIPQIKTTLLPAP